MVQKFGHVIQKVTTIAQKKALTIVKGLFCDALCIVEYKFFHQ